jgi:hypothetical protein
MKVIIKYHIECGHEIIECENLEQAERKIRHMSEVERYLIKTEMEDEEVINQTLIGL